MEDKMTRDLSFDEKQFLDEFGEKLARHIDVYKELVEIENEWRSRMAPPGSIRGSKQYKNCDMGQLTERRDTLKNKEKELDDYLKKGRSKAMGLLAQRDEI
jgi:hypothetical protein